MPFFRFPEPELFLPGQGEPSLRWGILGPGSIASAFVNAMRRHTHQRPHAVASRDIARAEAFARQWSIERTYARYTDLVEDPEIDVVYVATPHSEHLANGLLALRAGKHVLIEKPIATSAREAEILVQEAHARELFLMEAMWSRYLPHTSVLRRLVADGALGEVRHVFADLSQQGPSDPSHRLYRRDLGGGALLDLGVYTAQFSSMTLGAPTAVAATGAMTDSGVDAFSTLVLSHPGNAQSTLINSILARSTSGAYIAGTQARIDLGGPFHNPTTLSLAGSDYNAPQIWQDPTGLRGYDGLGWQATALALYVSRGLRQSPLHPLDEVVQIMRTLDLARERLLGHD